MMHDNGLDVIDREERGIAQTPGNRITVNEPVQRVQTKYTTAMSVQRRRELATVEHYVLQESALLGADAYYAWGAGKDRVEGPSKDLAMAMCRAFGNCAVDMGEVQETVDAWIFTATFVDLETGFTLARQFRQSKEWKVYGKFDEARKEDIRFQIGQSKAVRNVILNSLPAWLVRRAMDKAKGGVREKIEKLVAEHGLPAVIDRALAKLADLKVDEQRVLSAMGRQIRNALTIEDLVILQGNIAALINGSDTIEAMFPVAAAKDLPSGRSSFTEPTAPANSLESAFGPGGQSQPAPAPEEEARRLAALRLANGCTPGENGCSTDFSVDGVNKKRCASHMGEAQPAAAPVDPKPESEPKQDSKPKGRGKQAEPPLIG
jgi:hypothetical protein